MITRIYEIKNLGSLQHFQSPAGDDYELQKKTVIYADNAVGKTTLSSVFKSYATDDPVALAARQTLGQDEPPFVKFQMKGKDRRFSDASWKGKEDADPNIAVFDHDYVERNVFSSEISSDHLKTIHRIVIGSEGRKLNDQLKVAKKMERDARKNMRGLDKVLTERKQETGRDDYLTLNKKLSKDVVEKRINAFKKQLSAFREKSKIETLPIPQKQDLKLGDFGALKMALLQKRDLHSEAKERVLQRIANKLRSSPNAESFLNIGIKLIPKDETCPFCDQSLFPASSLLDDYKIFFDKSAEEQKKKLSIRLSKFRNWSPENQLRKLIEEIQKARTNREKWNPFLDDLSEFPEFDCEPEIENMNRLHQRCTEEFHKKEQSLDYAPNLKDLTLLEEDMKKISDQLPAINNVIDDITIKINQFKKDIALGDETDIRRQLRIQEALLVALDSDAIQWRMSYSSAKMLCGEKEKDSRKCTAALHVYCDKSYGKFQEGINDTLEEFGLKYTIDGLQPKSTNQSNEVSAAFSIKINSIPVSANKRQESAACFRNTLSEGEKNALGFAFFLTDLRQSGKLENTIVVMDDPLSSFDTDRHESTAWLLTKLSKECLQLIILTHRRDFAGHLHAQSGFEGQFFKIESIAEKASFSLYDIRADQQHAHDRHIDYLVQVSKGGSVDKEKVPSTIRKVFEHVLRAKYKRHLSVSEFGRIVRQLKDNDLCDVVNEIDRLNVQTREHCHAESKELPAMSDAAWRTLAGSALETLDNV